MLTPLIVACSVIRSNKNDLFASEYIMSQLLMQWLKNESDETKLYGIRYFSCASIRASNMGYNYVFPVSGEKLNDREFCNILGSNFRLIKPYFIHEFDSIEECQHALDLDCDIEFI